MTANGDADDDANGDHAAATRAEEVQAHVDAERLQPATALRHELSKSQPLGGGQPLPFHEKIARHNNNKKKATALACATARAGHHCCATARGRRPPLWRDVARPPGSGHHC